MKDVAGMGAEERRENEALAAGRAKGSAESEADSMSEGENWKAAAGMGAEERREKLEERAEWSNGAMGEVAKAGGEGLGVLKEASGGGA